MSRVLLVTVQSSRTFSWRQSTGVGTACTQLLQLPPLGVVLGRFMSCIMSWPPRLIRLAGMMLPGNGSRV